MKSMFKLLVLGLGATTATSAHAQGILYAIDEGTNSLVSFDPVTLDRTVIGSLGIGFDFGDMAWDSSSETMYLVDGWGGRDALFTVDLSSGAASFVGNHGQEDVFGLEVDSSTGTMYACESTSSFGLYEIDPSSGAMTFIGDASNISLDSLAYDSSRDMLVGANGGPGDLYDMDRSNGSGTLIYNGDFFNNCGMTYDADRDIFWMIDWSGNLYNFDPNNGYIRTLVSGGLGAHDGLVYVSESGGAARLSISGSCPGSMSLNVSGATPGGNVAFIYAFGTGNVVIPNGACAGTELGLNGTATLLGVEAADANGDATFSGNAPAAACGRVFVQALDLDTCTTTNVEGL